jgi:hypothetical protein
LGDPGDLARVGDEQATDERRGPVIEVPRVGRGLHDQAVGRAQVRLRPGGPLVQVDAARRQHHLLAGIHPADHQVVLVQINGQMTFNGE